MTEPTPEQQRKICETLARHQGIMTCSAWVLIHVGMFGGTYEKRCTHDQCLPSVYFPPNPFTDAAASRALREWLRKQGALYYRFIHNLCDALDIPSGRLNEKTFHDDLGKMLTAPLAIIATAAHSAITEERKQKQAAPPFAPRTP